MKHSNQIPLCRLDIGECGEITAVCIENEKCRRLTQLGVIEGSTISKVLCSPLGDPCAYFVHGSLIAIRKNDAQKIFVRLHTNGEQI